MRPLYQVLRHLLFASLTRAQFGVQNDRSVLGINNEFSGVCYTYVSVYPVLADPDYITITKPYRGSVTTQYTVPPQGDEPGIVIVEQPGGASAPENIVIPATDDRSYVIIIRPHSGPNPISAPITQVVPPRSGQPGQIIIETPETQVGDATPGVLQPLMLEPKETTGYVTVLQPLTGTLASLQLITISPTGTNRGSVIINVPTSALNGGSLQGLTLEPAQDGDYITVIEPAGTSFRGTVPIQLTVPPSNGNPGTVIIQTPVPGTLRPLALEPLTPNTLGALGLAGQTITLQPADATGYVTIIEPAEGSVTPTAPIRTTIPPTGTKPGTVLIQTPPGWNDGGDGMAFQSTRTRPQGSVSYTTITRGVPMGFGGSGSGSDGGSNGGSGSGGGDDLDDGSGTAQGRPGQGSDGESGPRQTLTIPPEGVNPGTVLVLTPEDPNNPQTGNNGEGDNGAQATGGSSGGSQGGSGGGSDSSSGGNGQNGGGESPNNGGSGGGSNSGSGSSSGRPGQGASSSNGGSAGGDDDPVQGGVQGSGSGSEDDDEGGASGNGGSSGSNNGNGSSNGGSSSSGGGNTGSGGSDSAGGSGGSGTRSAGSSSSTKGASSGGSGGSDGPTSGGTESEGGGSEGGSDSGNGSSGGTGSTSGGKGSSGDDDDSGSGGNAAGGDNGGSGHSSSSRRASTSRRPTTRSPIVRTSPSTYVVTSSSTVFTITADVVETLTNAEPQRTRRLTAGVEGLGGSGTATIDRTTFRRPSNSRSAESAATASGDAESDSQQTTQAPGRPSSTRRAGASSSSDYSGTVDTRVRPGGSGLSSTRSRTSTSGQASRPVNDETTIVDSGPVETNDPGSDAEGATSSGGNPAQSSSTRSGQGSSIAQSTSAGRPVAASSSSSASFTARPAGFSTNSGNAEAGGTSQASQRSSRETSSVSGVVEGETRSTAAGNNGGAASEDDEATSQASGASSGSQSTSAVGAGSSSASTRSSATTSGGTAGSSGSTSSTASCQSASVSDAGSSQSDAARGSSAGTSIASQIVSQSSSATTRSERINIETLVGTQSVPESDRVEQPGDISSTRSATSSGAGLTGQPAGGAGGSTTGQGSQTTTVEDDDASATSSGEALTGGPAGGATSGSGGESSSSEDSGAETSAASRNPGSETASDDAQETGDPTGTAQPEDGDTSLISPQVPVPTDPLPSSGSGSQSLTGGVEGISAIRDSSFESPELPLPTAVSTGPLPDSNLLPTATDEETSGGSPGFEAPTGSQAAPSDNGGLGPDSGETATDGPTDNETSKPDSSSASSDDEASETGSGDPDETGTGASGGATQTGSSGNGDDDGASTTVGAGAEPSNTDADTESETSDPDATTDGPGPGAGPDTDEDGQTITDASGGNPTAGIPADNSLTTDAPDGALATITVFRAGRGPARTTLYVPPQASNDPWTVVIETPVSETQAEAATARGDDDVLATTSAIGGNTNVTIFRAGSSPARRTLYVPPRFANEPGTIVIETPTGTGLSPIATATETGLETTGVRPNITVYSSGTASSRITIYVPPTASDGDGYIIIETPVSEDDPDATESAEDGSGPTAGTPAGIANVTVYSSGTASERRTLYIPPTASGEAGTVIIETPVSEPDAEETGGDDDSSQTTGLEPGVRPNVTVFSSGTASERITLYIPPTASGEAGTIVIQTPVSDEDSDTITGGPGDESGNTATSDDRTAITIYTDATGSTANTRYISPTASGEQGTYIIETPTSGPDGGSDDTTESLSGVTVIVARTTVTVYSGGPGSVTRTVYVPPTASDEAGTMYIETPIDSPSVTGDDEDIIVAQTTVTVFSGGPGSVTRTVYVPPTASGEAGTLYIETPTGSEATATGEEEVISATRTVTVYTGVPGSVTRTVYVPPTAIDEPGTLFIETPVDDSGATATDGEDAISAATTVTIFSGGPGSVTRSVYVPPTASGEAGTMYIETPTDGSEADSTSEEYVISAATTVTIFSGGSASVTRTVYIPPTASGEAGTLVIETPADGSQASPTSDGGAEETEGSTETGAPTEAEEEAISAATTVTIFSGGPAAVTRTTYIPPTASGEAGTLVIVAPTGGDDDSSETGSITGTGASGPTAIVTPEGPGNVTIYSGGPASSTTTRFIPATASGEPGTVVIETPTAGPQATGIGNVTIVTGGPATVTQTRYIPATVTDEPGTIVIETPTSQVDEEGSAGNTTIYSAVSATGTRTIYIPPTVSGEPGTIIVETPAVRAVTVYTDGPASTTRTLTIPGTASGDPDTILIETPTSGSGSGPANVTVYTGVSATVATTRFVPGTASDEPGTFIVETPIGSPTYVTVYSGGPGTAVTTIYLTPSASGDSTTMIIQTPTQGSEESATGEDESVTVSETGSQIATPSSAGNVTIYSGGLGTVRQTIYIPPTASGEQGTVIIETPTSVPDVEASETVAPTGIRNVTIVSGGPGTATRTIYIPPTASGEAGTIVIETPTDSDYDTSVTETSEEAAATTIAPTVSGGNVTIISGGPASVTRTVYIPPTASGEPGTVIIETPTGDENSGVPETGTITEAPGTSATRRGNVTIYTQAPGTAGGTFYFPPDDPEESGTVIIETLPGDAEETEAGFSEGSVATTVGGRVNTTIFSGGPVTAPRTLYIPATVSGEPDTVLVETPTTGPEVEPSESATGQRYTTIFGGGSGTATRTITIPATVSGELDTVLIETPTGGAADITITRGGPVSVATTITIPGAPGEPDTVLIETPTESGDAEPLETGSGVGEVTSTRGGPITAATTIMIPGESGQPDTVIVETPRSSDEDGPSATDDGQDDVTITRGGPVTAATTVTISGVSGGPDTVYIETPTESADGGSETTVTGAVEEITITRGGPVTAATTITIPGVSGGPDTVYVEIPTESATGGTEPPVTGAVQEITITRGGPVTAATTITIPGESGGLDTVLIEVPTESAERSSETDYVREVTITRGGPVTAATTLTIPGESGGPDTVLIETPTGSSGDDHETSATGTVQGEVTITRGGPVTAATTLTIPGASGQPDTVVVETPTGAFETPNNALANVTVYSGGPVLVTRTIYLPPDASGEAGTIVIETPDGSSPTETTRGPGNVTIYTGIPGTATRTVFVPATASGEPGTILIETPTGSSGDEETTGSIVATATGPLTTSEGRPNTTIFSGGSGSSTRTIYFPPASDDPDGLGTVVIETPTTSPEDEETTSVSITETASDGEATGIPNVTRYVDGPASITTTYTIPPASSGEPGTVVIQTPSASPSESEASTLATGSPTELPNVTRYVGGPASVTTTYTIPPASSGEPGTVVIQTPSASPAAETTYSEATTSVESPSAIQNVTRFVGGPASVTTTIYIPPASSGEPGTILIQTPSSAPEETSSTAAASTTRPPTVAQNTTIFAGGAGSTTRTIYIPPVSEGEPGTVLIETPTASPAASTTPISGEPEGIPTTSTPIVAGTNVTIFRAAPATATAGRTLYDPPTAAGEPGTIIVETMVVTPVESSTSGSAAPLSVESPVFTTLSGTSTSSAAAGSSSTTSTEAVGPTTSSSAVASPSTTSSAAAAASSSSSAAAAASSSSSAAAAAATSSSSAAPAATTSSSSAAAAAISSSSAVAAAASSSSSAAAPVVTTSSSAAVPVVATSSSSTTSTSMMPQLAFGPTFDCDGFGYTVASLLANTLTRVNLNTGARTDIRTGIGPGGPINGIGFNKLDNYIYGFYQQPLVNALLCGLLGCKRSGLIRIAKDGRWEVLDLVIGTNAISMGDVDDQGRFWVSEGGGRWWCIDLRPTSSTFGKVLSSGTSATDLLSGVGDWAYVPGGGNYLYALQASVIESGLLRTNIVRWSLTTQNWERYQSYPGLVLTALNLVWGAVMAAPDGTLFAQESVLGQTWKFSLSSTANPTPIPGGAILNLLGSDGAKCAGALVS